MKKISLDSRLIAVVALAVMLIASTTPAVSAQVFTEEYNDTYISIGGSWYPEAADRSCQVDALLLNSNAANSGLSDVFMQVLASEVTNYDSLKSSEHVKVDICISNPSGTKGALYSTGTFGYFKYKAGGTDYLQIWLELDEPNAEVINGNKYLKFFPKTGESITYYPHVRLWTFESYYINTAMDSWAVKDIPGVFVSFSGIGLTDQYSMPTANNPTYGVMSGSWANTLTVRTEGDGITERSIVNITKSIPDVIGTSLHYVKFGDTVYSGMGATNVEYVIMAENYPFTVDIYNGFSDKWYNETFFAAADPDDPDDPDNTIVTIYVRNSQTYALIANANIVISASVNGNLHEVVNETVPSGIYSIDLQPTGGGMPNPDFYRLITTAEGYISVMPYMDFEVVGGATIYEYLDPTGGAPEDENNTFIDFFVRDMSANPISGATVNFGGYTLITNSAGYTIFEVDKSKTYSWTVSKSGYGSLTGNVVIGDDPRHTINTVLAPAVTPTIPTSIPTLTPISPTPTMTSPTGEPVSNWLEWFAAHFGMILGGGAEIGKIFMWLCFSVPVGVYVGKEAKAGAAGFLAGAGVVTLFFVLIGWVPIWLLVLLALIIGLLYAKVFNNSDNGGGR